MLKLLLMSVSVSLGLLVHPGFAEVSELNNTEPEQITQFQRIEQPVWMKGAVTVAGLGLIGLELWWFLGNQSQAKPAKSKQGIQEITITVNGGYEPNRVVVHVGQPVRLNFERSDPNGCLEEIRLPEFQIHKQLPLNQVTTVEFTPSKPGDYEFTCGMNMFRGVIEVKPTSSAVS